MPSSARTVLSNAWSRAPRWVWAAWLAAWTLPILAYVTMSSAEQTIVYDLSAVSPIVAIAIGLVWYRPPDRAPWIVFGLGTLAFAAGEILYSALEGTDLSAFPGPVDVLYVGGYLLFCLALARFLRGTNSATGSLIDAGVVVVAATSVLWTLVVSPNVAEDPLPLSDLGLALTYPLLDIALVWLLARVMLSAGRIDPSLLLFAAGFAAFLLADVVYGIQAMADSYVAGFVDYGWLAGYALWGAAALHPAMTRLVGPSDRPGQLSTPRLVLLGAVATAPTIAAVAQQWLVGAIDPLPFIVSSFVMFVLVVLRLSLVLREQRTLLEAHRRLQRSLERLALEDPLTGLVNRRGFIERLEHALEQAPEQTAVVIMDLDDFKTVNDSLGHLAGDTLLRILGRRVLGALRPGDTAARLGGDEFAILMEDCPSVEVATRVAERLLATTAQPVDVGGATIVSHGSVGIAVGAGGARDADALMGGADLALYRAKAAGQGHIEVFDSVLHDEALLSMAIRNGLAFSVERGQLELYYQPIMAINDREWVAVEALVRWNHPDLGFLVPKDFIALAETTNQMVEIGRWIIAEAFGRAAGWLEAGHADVAINVNISPSQLRSETFVDDVTEALKTAGLPARLLTLEITETAIDLADDPSTKLRTLAALGARIAIDDFGVGHSSLSRVAALPVSELKLDRSLLTGDLRMIKAVARLGKTLGMRLVAEGVESPSHLSLARRIGCDAAQGFLLSPPLSADQLERVLDHDAADRARRPAEQPKRVAVPGL